MSEPRTADKVYRDEPYVSVRWDARRGWLEMTWKAFANSAELRSTLEMGITATRENRATRWLVDGLNMRVVPLDDQKWIAEDWVPRVMAAGVKFTAFVLPRSELAKLNLEATTARASSLNPSDNAMRFFPTRQEAVAWLSAPGI